MKQQKRSDNVGNNLMFTVLEKQFLQRNFELCFILLLNPNEKFNECYIKFQNEQYI